MLDISKNTKKSYFKRGNIRINKTCFSKENKLIVQRDRRMEERKTEQREGGKKQRKRQKHSKVQAGEGRKTLRKMRKI